tara:strand:+ start:286 stop:510 length:225 start_codon:yes stop_codon:yes gene_type:complete
MTKQEILASLERKHERAVYYLSDQLVGLAQTMIQEPTWVPSVAHLSTIIVQRERVESAADALNLARELLAAEGN